MINKKDKNLEQDKTIQFSAEQMEQLANQTDDDEYEYITPHYTRNAILVVLLVCLVSAVGTYLLVNENMRQRIEERYIASGYVVTKDATATSDDIAAGKSAYVRGELVEGTFEPIDYSLATATADDILKGYSAYTSEGLITGTIPTYSGATTITPSTRTQVIRGGQYIDSLIIISGDANLQAGNIASGITIFGVKGSYSGQ